jgi:hypothetical protein
MTLEQLFERARTRAIFFTAIAVVVALMLIVRYFVFPRFDPSLTQGVLPLAAKLLEDISATIVVTVLVAAFLWWITPSRVRNSGIVVVEPRELRRHFAEALAHSSDWRFFGGCGRYFRSAVLQEMSRRARQESTSKSVTAIVLNPENDLLCERHSRYRAGTRRGKNEGNWTKARVKQELLATIIVTKAVAHKEGLIDAHIYVSDHFSCFRVDLSQVCAIETREDATAPALRSDAGSYYFAALNDEYRIVKEQAKLVDGGEAECAAVIDLMSLKMAIKAMTMNSLNLTDSELDGVVKLVLNISNPYE